MQQPSIERISLNPSSCKGHTFRYHITGSGLIQLYFGGVYENCFIKSHYGHWSQKGAQRWNENPGVDWDALEKLSRKIQYHIRNRLAVAKVPGRPILPQAYQMTQNGYTLKEYPNYPAYANIALKKHIAPSATEGSHESTDEPTPSPAP